MFMFMVMLLFVFVFVFMCMFMFMFMFKMFMFMFMFMFKFRFMFMFMFMLLLSHVIPYAKHPLEIPPFSLRIFLSLSHQRLTLIIVVPEVLDEPVRFPIWQWQSRGK